MKKIAVFASGSGTNTQKIIEYFRYSDKIKPYLILTNNKDAYVVQRAKENNIPVITFDRSLLYETDYILDILTINCIDLVVLAGFLWLVPQNIIRAFEGKMINIHPALLPKYGGKGMYGMKVHQAVKENNDKETGITIHWVNEEYDKGRVIRQEKCAVSPSDTPEEIADKVHQLEYRYYPEVIEQLLSD